MKVAPQGRRCLGPWVTVWSRVLHPTCLGLQQEQEVNFYSV